MKPPNPSAGPGINPREITRLRDLLQKYNGNRRRIAALLAAEDRRFDSFSRRAAGLLLDYSRCGLDRDSVGLLLELAGACGLEAARERMFAGEAINVTEHRAVLHPLWRNRRFESLLPHDEALRLSQALQGLGEIAEALRQGRLSTDHGATIRHVVHIGIGGSLLGPRMLVQAFAPSGASGRGSDVPRIHFLSSVDAGPREALLAEIDAAETAVVVVSKSFTTAEVMTHARAVFEWQSETLDAQAAERRRFAITSRPDRAAGWSIPQEQVLEMGEWTGGRFSLWSPVGLTAAVAMGLEAFDRLVAGGAEMDRHFRESPMPDNLPVIAGLIDVWHRNACGISSLAVIPYESRLAALPGWLQQVAMESNGKGTTMDGEPAGVATSPVIFGDCGTDAQHSFFQAFHQGTDPVAVDFIGVINPAHADREAQARLLSHMLAQATALARGKSIAEVRTDMRRAGCSDAEIEEFAAHRVMPGDRPSNVILLDELSPETLGALLVFYEHRVFVQSVIWGINAFDQWGVELGKTLAGAIEPSLAVNDGAPPEGLEELRGILAHIHKVRR